MFAPFRYRIEEHLEYDIDFWRNNYRSLSILKDRDGSSDGQLPLYFNGAVDEFREMPSNEGSHNVELGELMRKVQQERQENG